MFPRPPCPTNGQPGRRVQTLTVQALLAAPLDRLRPVNSVLNRYYFCPDPACPTVYYSADGAQTFAETDLRECVYQKHPADDGVWVCYCFRLTRGDLRRAPESVERIRAGVAAGQCACEIRNPQGTCCLGTVKREMLSLQPNNR
mgnify:CR=1 FL=1